MLSYEQKSQQHHVSRALFLACHQLDTLQDRWHTCRMYHLLKNVQITTHKCKKKSPQKYLFNNITKPWQNYLLYHFARQSCKFSI